MVDVFFVKKDSLVDLFLDCFYLDYFNLVYDFIIFCFYIFFKDGMCSG